MCNDQQIKFISNSARAQQVSPLTAFMDNAKENKPQTSYPFNMRMKNLKAIQRKTRTSCAQSTAKSLNTLRQLLQPTLNQELHQVIDRYVKDYFEPAANNIEMNQQAGIIPNNGIPPKECIKSVCKQILDEAKKMY